MVDRERPWGFPGLRVGEETQRRPPLVPKREEPKSSSRGEAGRAVPCYVMPIAGH